LSEPTGSITALIVDDEPLARMGLRDLLAKDQEIRIVGECASGAQAVETIRSVKPALVFLDIQMPGMDGFEVLEHLAGETLPVCIFVTAFDRHSVRAFEVHALDYVLKPVEEARFAQAVSRAKERIRERRVARFGEQVLAMLGGALVSEPGAGYLTRLVVKSARRTVLLPVEEIDWIEGASYYVKVHAGGKEHLLRETMTALEARLDPRRFFRVHRSAVVNLARIAELLPTTGGGHTVLLRNGARIRLSRSRRAALESVLGRSI
jgi:two-component system LytT family response regulator